MIPLLFILHWLACPQSADNALCVGEKTKTLKPWADSANTYARLVEENGRWTDPAKIRLSHDNEGGN